MDIESETVITRGLWFMGIIFRKLDTFAKNCVLFVLLIIYGTQEGTRIDHDLQVPPPNMSKVATMDP